MKQTNSLMGSAYSPFSKTKRIVVRSLRRVTVMSLFLGCFLQGYSQEQGPVGAYDSASPSFKIYPNPAKDIVTIDLPVNWQKKNLKFEIFNLNGQVLNNLQTTIYKETVRLDLGKLPNGFYFVKLSCEGQTGMQKIVKQ